jgi:hypothetical protein
VDLKFFSGLLLRNRCYARRLGANGEAQMGEGSNYLCGNLRRLHRYEELMPALNPDRWQEVSPYLDEVLALPAEERADWLTSLRGRNPELASLVEALLADHRLLEEEHFLEHSPTNCQSWCWLGKASRIR